MRGRRFLAVAMALAGLFLVPGVRGDDSTTKAEETGLAVGKKMPFHVVDFVHSKYHCGCPTVMTTKTGGRGIILWSREASDPAFQLARALDDAGTAEDKMSRFLVVFDAEAKALATKAEGLSRIVVGKARHSAKQELDEKGIEARTSILVFFLDKKEIRSRWSFTADELTQTKVKEIVAAAKKFAAEDR